MLSLCCSPYRGYGIRLQVVEIENSSFNGPQRRYTVAWSVHGDDPLARAIASFPEPVEFMSTDDALRYAEARAHTFIDCTMARGQT
jgi:hypothetical protein